ncbi:transcription factor TFIIIB component B'' homolog Bdp1 isoform X1 [Osmia lignaria lignaria]|uniref:transcription factor TFIIIB component B'' homolog Bdp1 isoform X1 n=1 Tax=Osmia lignaria lignaria TaxID=1437193 RepID=UPI00402B7659
MKRARIKAMVTVPARRKTTQDIPNETIDVTESDERDKDITENIPVVSQQAIDNSLQENQAQEDLVVEHTKNESLHANQDNEPKDNFIQSLDEPKKEIIQSLEISNATQITSPIKSTQNRLGFMRPTPKLDSGGRVRRNSIQGSGASASESEDDSRRATCTLANNTKNDSLQSSQPSKDTVVNNTKNNLIKSKMGQKRRMLVSESARKLAEARREFHLKHENKTPDRSKLTMYDLIYYNPVTNPMKKSKESGAAPRKVIEYQPDECQEEENEDDPSSAMPVPQVKVGPNGQLIIDEQSLVIEQTDAKKSREVLGKEAIVDDENNGSGFYKKRQKSKDWPKWETLKFYKALNTVGTDFSLMQSLFPNRTRQEMKVKFKKEEKVNRNLVEKALAYHQEFDTDMLEKSLATFEDSAKEHLNLFEKRKQQRSKDKQNMKFHKRRRIRIVASSIGEMDASDNEENSDCSDVMQNAENTKESDPCQETLNKRNKKGCKRLREDKSSSETNDDKETLSVFSDVDSDTEIYRVRPTRSGRIPKVKKLQGPDINTLDSERSNNCSNSYEITEPLDDNTEVSKNLTSDNANFNSETQYADSIKTVIPSIGNVEPGSLVILSKESPEEPGKNVLQVYMVSSNVNSENLEESNITPINLSPELLATVTTKLSDAESVAVKTECF